jgi:hypothetical protein
MSAGLFITGYLASALIAGIAGSLIARAKNRYAGFWTALCFIVPPAVLVLMLLPRMRRTATTIKVESEDSDNLDTL